LCDATKSFNGTHATDERVFVQPTTGGTRAKQFEYLQLEGNNMNASKIMIAVGFAVATTSAFAETGVGTYQVDNVANVYGRAGAPNVKITGAIASQPGTVADSGRDSSKGETKLAVKAGRDVIEFGRS
jgi:hypothetical protein